MKTKSTITLLLFAVLIVCTANSQVNDSKQITVTETDMNNQTIIEMHTTLGDMTIALYNETPQHRDNFVKLVEEGYYDGVLFHRVIKDFMIQTGDPDSKNAAPNKMLGSGNPGYTIEAEFNYPRYFHKYGALAAARTGDQVNPQKRSSGSQFYIVTGKKYTTSQLSQMNVQMLNKKRQAYFSGLVKENKEKIQQLQSVNDTAALNALQNELIQLTEDAIKEAPMTNEIIEAYTTVGGTPHLDAEYTVFGEIIEGMEIVDKIQNVATNRMDRPVEDVKIISMKVVKK